MKRFLAVLLAGLLLFSGCKQQPSDTGSDTASHSGEAVPAANSTIRVLYSSKDSLDPYSCVTEQNRILSQLLYDPLLILNNQYEIEYRLAESVTVSGTLCTVVLRSAKFSDGSAVTPADVVFSFNKAKASNTRYAAALKYAVSAKATGANTLSVTLSRNDPYFANLLTFPIMKSGSDMLKDTDNRALPPIGAGRYVFNTDSFNLEPNVNYYEKASVITKVITVDCPDNESVDQAVKAGMIDLYYTDLTDNVIPKMNGNSADISQNHLVFLGVNPKNTQLADSYFRQAISAAVDRETVCSAAYFSKAQPATGPFPSVWSPTSGFMTMQSKQNLATAAKNIELAGYTKKDQDGFYLLKNNKPITLSLLVNSNNSCRVSAAEKIADNITAAGIKVTLRSVSADEYKSRLNSGTYDLYSGEIRMEENMDLGGLANLDSAAALSSANNTSSSKTTASSKTSTSSKAAAASSADSSASDASATSSDEPAEITLTTAEAFQGFYSGQYTLQDLIVAFTAELPVIPVCFQNGLVIYSDRFGSGITPSRSDLFHGIALIK